MHAGTTAALSKPQQPRMGYVPCPVEVFNITLNERNLVTLKKAL